MSEKVKFIKLTVCNYFPYTQGLGSTNVNMTFTTLYALDSDGEVWYLYGNQWQHIEQPNKQS